MDRSGLSNDLCRVIESLPDARALFAVDLQTNGHQFMKNTLDGP
jgi:hypothetical protein